MRDQFVDARIFVKALPVLPRAEAVIETLNLFRREVAIRWLLNAHTGVLAASAFSANSLAGRQRFPQCPRVPRSDQGIRLLRF